MRGRDLTGAAPADLLRAACPGHDRIGVAVSGGGDSVAALVLAAEALGPARVAAVTVDHGLRPGSADEAAQVAALCARLGVGHDILRWQDPQGGNLMAAARQARLDLIGGWARDRVAAVVLAHTRDDQAETVLMRLARGSGVDGLCGMDAVRQAAGVTWLRPFLTVPRAALRDALRARGIGWIEDPTNADPRYQRARARRALAALSDLGIDAAGLAATAGRMQRARAVLRADTAAAIAVLVTEERGTLRIDRAALSLPPELRDRLFAHLLTGLSGAGYRPRLDALQRLVAAGQGTLSGCVLRSDGGALRLYREARAVAGVSVPAPGPWDGRWWAQGPGAARIAALGEAGLAQLSAQARGGLHPHWRATGLPRDALLALPGLWTDGALIAAPLAFWPQGWTLSARPVAAIPPDESLSH